MASKLAWQSCKRKVIEKNLLKKEKTDKAPKKNM